MLNDVDSMSKEAQHALRRTMEKYSHACRLIMLCSNLSRVLLPVRSRCICVRVPAPAVDEVASVRVPLVERGNATFCTRVSHAAFVSALVLVRQARCARHAGSPEDGQRRKHRCATGAWGQAGLCSATQHEEGDAGTGGMQVAARRFNRGLMTAVARCRFPSVRSEKTPPARCMFKSPWTLEAL